MSLIIQSPLIIANALERIKDYIHLTPIMHSKTLNSKLKHHICFKVESFQKTGAFKVRSVLNHLLTLKEINKLPSKIVAYSTGNHGIGVSYAANLLGIEARVYLPKGASKIKYMAAKEFGATVIWTENRAIAEEKAKNDGENGYYHLSPSDSDTSIAGAGTMCLEALTQLDFEPDAIFAACGGGGLLSGSYLAKELASPSSLMIGCEPENANDAYLSLKTSTIHRFHESPTTIADGLTALSLSERTFNYIKKLDDFYLVDEAAIYYWTRWIMHLLKIVCEPSSAVSMAGAVQWLKKQNSPKKILVLLSGGNVDSEFYKKFLIDKALLLTPTLH